MKIPRFVEAEIAKQYLVKSDLLAYVNGDELQHTLDVFIREVHRPGGQQYLPESIYYLCLGKSNSYYDARHSSRFDFPRYSILFEHQ